MADRTRLDGPAVEGRLARIDELLDRVEGVPGPTAEAAIEAVRALTEVYGEALARMRDLAGPQLADELVGDELLRHLMVLHGIHPGSLEERVTGALDGLRPAVRKRGGEVQLAGITGSVATVRLKAGGCGSSASGVEEAVREAVLAVAPELTEVRREPESGGDTAFVPLNTLTERLVAPDGAA